MAEREDRFKQMDPTAIARARMRAQCVWGSDFNDPQKALTQLVAVQAQEFPSALWSLAQRSGDPPASVLRRAFDRGRILRTHVLRPTWHFVAPRDLRWLMTLSGPRVVAWTARRCNELGLDAKTLARTNDVIARAVAEKPLTRRDLTTILERRRLSPRGQRMPYILMRAELDMIICSGPLEGKQHTYAAFDSRVPSSPRITRDEALGRLAKKYFASRGPATLKDFGWWSGLPMSDVRRGVEIAGRAIKKKEADGRTYFLTEQPVPRASRPRIDLVQIYDEMIIAYSESRDVLQTGEAQFPVPASSEGFPHVILRDGRLLGRWHIARTGDDVRVETVVKATVDDATRVAVDRAGGRFRRFATG